MLIPNELVLTAKEKLGQEAAEIIAKDLDIQNYDSKNLKGSCPLGHSDSTPSFIWNDRSQSFHCFSCGKNYNIIDHYMAFDHLTFLEATEKLFHKTDTKFLFGEKGVKTEKDYKYPHFEHSEDRLTVEQYALNRHISKETLDWVNIQEDYEGNMMFPYYDTNDVLCLVKYRPARKVEKSENKMWCQKGSDTTPILFNMNRVDFTNGPLVITEGEIDTLSVIEAGYKNVISVPFGSNNFTWIEKSFEFLEKFNNIIIFSDNDAPGIAMRKEVIFRLGVWKCRFIDLPQTIVKDGKLIKIKDANELLYYTDKETVLDYIANAQEMPVVGVEDLAQIPDFDIESALGLYSGIEGIDKIIYKFLLGSVLVVTGKKGAGKSTLINQCFVCEPLQQGYDVFIYSGELDPGILKSWVELTMAGPVHTKMKGDFIHLIEKNIRLKMEEWYTKRIWLYKQKSNKIQDIIDKAIAITRKYGVKVWVIDNLTTIDLDANSTELLEKQKKLIVDLNDLSIMYGILIVLICHPRKVMAGQDLVSDDVGGNGALTNLAPYVASVKRYDDKDKKGEKGANGKWRPGKEPVVEDVEIEIMKNRFTGRVGKTRLFFNYKSYRFFLTQSELFKKFKWDNSENPMPKLEDEDKRFAQPDFMKG